MVEISLIVHRIGGRMFQVLADEDALYVVYLGNVRGRDVVRRAIVDPLEFAVGDGVEVLRKADVEYVRVLAGMSLTEICLRMADGGEVVWHMNCGVPEEGIRGIFEGVRLRIVPLPLERELVETEDGELAEGIYDSGRIRRELFGMPAEEFENDDDMPTAPGIEVLLEWGICAASVLFTALWWLNQSKFVFALNLLFLPAVLVWLGVKQGTAAGRFRAHRLLWLLPGIGLMLINVRINVVSAGQIALPAAVIAMAMALLYIVCCGKRRALRKAAVVLVLGLLTYAPGAALSLNTLKAEEVRIVRVDPMLIRPGWVDVRLDGEVRRMYASPRVTGSLSSAGWCELRQYRGMMGIEYWIVMPSDLPDAV